MTDSIPQQIDDATGEVLDSRDWLNFPDEDYSDSLCLLLPKGQATLIDVAFFEFATSVKWQVMGRSIFYVERFPAGRVKSYFGKCGYGHRRYPPKTTVNSLHRAVFKMLAVPDRDPYRFRQKLAKRDIDHKNRIYWDNRIGNLRMATKSQNAHNKAKPNRPSSSKYKGVSKVKGKNKWVAKIKLKGTLHHLGTFDDEFKAAQAYNAFVRKHIHEFGYTNPLSVSYPD